MLKYALPAGVLLWVSGCLVFDQLGWRGSDPAFSHKLHVEGEELECGDCHFGYDEGDQVALPKLKACMLCHEDIDEEASPDARPEAFYEDGQYKAADVNQLDPEVKFSHLAHVTDEQGCLDCHASVASSDAVEPWMGVSMERCVECHSETASSTECDSCHTQTRADVPPKTHDGPWDRFHGLDVRNRSTLTVDRCEICHEESTCATCHQQEMPANHNNFWRLHGHGLTAQMDRENCAACHRPDYCDRCHAEAVPQSHNGLWGATKDTHCFGCHASEAQQSCFLCHRNGAPSHALAPPKPPGHNPASDCRSCHLFISHVDNGDDCNSCHR